MWIPEFIQKDPDKFRLFSLFRWKSGSDGWEETATTKGSTLYFFLYKKTSKIFGGSQAYWHQSFAWKLHSLIFHIVAVDLIIFLWNHIPTCTANSAFVSPLLASFSISVIFLGKHFSFTFKYVFLYLAHIWTKLNDLNPGGFQI